MKNNFEIIEADSILDGEYDVPLYDKFIEAYRTKDLQILTPNGWVDIEGIGKTIEFEEWKITTSGGKEIICADKHILFRCDNLDFDRKKCDLTEIFCENLKLGDFISTIDGPEMVMEHTKTGKKSNMYDLNIKWIK